MLGAKSRNFRDLSLPVASIYLLAKPSTPTEVRDAIIERRQTFAFSGINSGRAAWQHEVGRAAFAVAPQADVKDSSLTEKVGPNPDRRRCRLLYRFLDAGNHETVRMLSAGVQKAPRHEVAGG